MNNDVHLETVLYDVRFDVWMCHLHDVEWRWEMPAREQRMHAKVFNFGWLCGTTGAIVRIGMRTS